MKGRDFARDFALALLVIIFASGLFLFSQRQEMNLYAYEYAGLTKEALGTAGGSGSQGGLFYSASAALYSAVYGEFSREAFRQFALVVPPAVGLLSALLIYVAARQRFGNWPSLVAAVVFAASPPVMMNALPGVYTPQLAGILAFPLSLAIFMVSLRLGQPALALLAGAVASAGAVSMETGILFPLAFSASLFAWAVILWASRQPFSREFAFAAAFALPSLLLPVYLGVGLPDAAPDFGAFAFNIALAAPLAIVSFAVCAGSVIRGKPASDEALSLPLFIAGVLAGGFDPPLALALFAIPLAHGAFSLIKNPSSRISYIAAVFAVFLCAFAFYFGVSAARQSYLGLALLTAVAAAGAVFMYDREDMRKYFSFGALAIAFFLLAFHSLLVPYSVSRLDPYWQGAFSWLSENATGGSVASITPDGMIAFESGREECGCKAELAKYLLSPSPPSLLREKGAGYFVFEKALIYSLDPLRAMAGDEETRIEVYRYYSHTTDSSGGLQAVYVSESGSALFVPIDSSGKLRGEQVYVNDIGAISFGRLMAIGNGTDTTNKNLVFVLPLRGADSNLFRILSGSPPNTTKVYENEGLAIFRLD
ncbi:MAG: hypothetical protein NT157_03050 [Candidatus Micrarchaeota archaeon]|nr:hypothetical protein [Candidatus Micrarchaeota archaeon]